MSIDLPQDPFKGKMVRGYCLEELLDRSTATAVYRARTEELWQIPEIIITILLVPDRFSEIVKKQFEARFLREAKKISLLRHPFLFPLYGYGIQENIYYLIAPDAQGQTLATHMSEVKRFSPSDALSIVTPVANALGYIHSQNIMYQFLQPESILFTSPKNIQVSGLGLSQLIRMPDAEDQARGPASYEHLKNYAGNFFGAAEYLAPEVVKGMEADASTDVYSLGIMLFEMLSGQPPFIGAGYEEIAQKHVREPFPLLHEVASDIPVALELVVNRAIQRNPEQRFQSTDEFIAAYSQALNDKIQRSRAVGVSQKIKQLQSLVVSSASSNLMLPSPNTSYEPHPPVIQPPDVIHESMVVGHEETPEHNFPHLMETWKQDFLHSMETLERDRLHSMEVLSSSFALSSKKEDELQVVTHTKDKEAAYEPIREDDELVRSSSRKLHSVKRDPAGQVSFQQEQFLTEGEGINIFAEQSQTGIITPHAKDEEITQKTDAKPDEASQHQLTWYQPQSQTVQDMAQEIQSMRQRLQIQSKRPVLPASSKRTVLPEGSRTAALPEESLPEESKRPASPEGSMLPEESKRRPVLPASSKRSVNRQ